MSKHIRAAIVLTILTVSCGKSKTTTDTAGGAVVPAPATLSVVDVETGRHIGADKRISDKTTDFATTDTIFATVHTSGAATSRTLAAKWTF